MNLQGTEEKLNKLTKEAFAGLVFLPADKMELKNRRVAVYTLSFLGIFLRPCGRLEAVLSTYLHFSFFALKSL